MWHPDEGTIHAWLDGELPADERARLEEHFDHCEECAVHVVEARGLVAGASRIVGALDSVPGGVIPATDVHPVPATKPAIKPALWRSLHLTPLRAALAATLLLATATIFTVRHGAVTSPRPERAAEAATAAAPAPMPTVAAAPPAAPPAAAPAAPSPRVPSRAATDPAVVAGPRPELAPAQQRAADQVVALNAAASASRGDSSALKSSRDSSASAPASQSKAAMSAATAAPPAAVASVRSAPAGQQQQPMRSARSFLNIPTFDQRAVGCYRLEADSSLALATDLRRFSLGRIDSTGAPGVRAVADGRVDSVIPGAGWRSFGRDSVALMLPLGAQRATMVFALADEGRSVGGRLTSAGRTTPIVVLRTKCP